MSLFADFAKIYQTNRVAFDAFTQTLNTLELELIHDFSITAHEYQIPPHERNAPITDYSTWLLLGGRGSGKTCAGAYFIINAVQNGAKHIALIGATIADVRNVMIEGISGIMALSPSSDKPRYYKSHNYLEWKNGARAYIFSGANPDKLRGPQFEVAWCDELCKWQYPEQTWDILQMGMRLGDMPRIIVTTTPKPLKILKKIKASPFTICDQVSTYDNKDFLPKSFFTYFVDDYAKTHMARQEIYGEIVEEVEHALWTPQLIDATRLSLENAPAPHEMEKIIIAVDPPVTEGKDADECGIIVLGSQTHIDEYGHKSKKAFVMADYSVQGLTTNGWANMVANAYKKFNATYIIAETNQGGNLVENVIRNAIGNFMGKFYAVRASTNKITRASPVSALYEQGKISHIGYFPELEEQMYQFSSEKIYLAGGKSPDRVDALVWGIHNIFMSPDKAEPKMWVMDG